MILLDTDPVPREVCSVLEVHQHYACAGGCKIEVVHTTIHEAELARTFVSPATRGRAS